MAQMIGWLMSNMSVALLVLALAVWGLRAATGRIEPDGRARALLGWMLLLPVGLGALWAFTGHAFYPDRVSRFIGWAPSPYEFEVAVANLGIGVSAVLAFRAGWGFRAATVTFTSCFLLGAAFGHVRQMLATGDFAPGNAGAVFWLDILLPTTCLVLLASTRRRG